MKKIFFLFLVSLITFGCRQIKIDQPDITTGELREHITFLASDSLKGRKPGTPECKIAAHYIGDQFKAFGYEPLADDGYQYFDVITQVKAGPNNKLSTSTITATLNEDFIPFSFSANTTAEGDLFFCGYGFDLNTDSLQWNDYEKVDVSGKWVLILQADPELDNDNSPFIKYEKNRDKVLTAKDKGAIGVLIVSGVDYDKRDQLTKLELDQMGTHSDVPVFSITRNLANDLLEKSGKKIEDLEATIQETNKPLSFDCSTTLTGTSEVIFKKVKTQNVIGFLEGNDPQLKKQVILIGGHYDHLGFGGPNSGSRVPEKHAIHHGADDNASGTASVIEIAEKLAAHRKSLRRSVIVMSFGAEELGLLGSKAFTENPPVDLKRIVTMINIDMVGRLKDSKELLVGGTGTSTESESILDSLVKGRDLKIAKSPNGFGPSDHASFYVENIPVFFFTTGAHEDYHTPRDVVSKINFEGLKEVDDYIYDLSTDLINRDSTLVFREAGPKKETSTRRKSGVTIGFMPSFTQTDNNGLGVDGVTPGRPGDLGGLKKGDVIIAINGKPIHNIYDYMARMNKLKFGETITVDVVRGEEKKVLLIQLEDK